MPFKFADGSDFLLADGTRFLVTGDALSVWLPLGITVIGIVCVVLINWWAAVPR